MTVECRVTYIDPKPHIVRDDDEKLLGEFTVNPGESIVVYNHGIKGKKDVRLIKSDKEDARIYAVDPHALISLISPDGTVLDLLVDPDTSLDFSQIKITELNQDNPEWQAVILDEEGKFTGKTFTAKFV